MGGDCYCSSCSTRGDGGGVRLRCAGKADWVRAGLRPDGVCKPGNSVRTAIYLLRLINTRGEKGPWSNITSATVAAPVAAVGA